MNENFVECEAEDVNDLPYFERKVFLLVGFLAEAFYRNGVSECDGEVRLKDNTVYRVRVEKLKVRIEKPTVWYDARDDEIILRTGLMSDYVEPTKVTRLTYIEWNERLKEGSIVELGEL